MNDTGRRQFIRATILQDLQEGYPFVWAWVKENNLDKIYSLIIEGWNKPGNKTEAFINISALIRSASNAKNINIKQSDLQHLIRHLQKFESFIGLDPIQREKKLVAIPNNGDYELLKVLKSGIDKKVIQYGSEGVFGRAFAIAKDIIPIKDVNNLSAPKVDSKLEAKSVISINPSFIASHKQMLKEGAKTIDELMFTCSEWKKRALDAEKQVEVLKNYCDDLNGQLSVQDEQLEATNEFLSAMQKAKTLLKEE